MDIIQSILTVKGDQALERAIASEIISEDPDLSETFLDEMSVQYGPAQVKKITSDPDTLVKD
jgi:hypothetical protein